MHILDIPLSLAFVAEAEHHAWNLDERQGHIVACSVHHLRQIVRRLLFLITVVFAMVPAESLVLLGFITLAVSCKRPIARIPS